jgi:hypothetical protein
VLFKGKFGSESICHYVLTDPKSSFKYGNKFDQSAIDIILPDVANIQDILKIKIDRMEQSHHRSFISYVDYLSLLTQCSNRPQDILAEYNI